MAVSDTVGGQPVTSSAVVNQLYKECLAAAFRREYYQELYNRTIRYAKHFDYAIGLGSAATGGSGLGILANPQLGWLCGAMTTVSVLLSVAKGVWDWPAKSKFALDRVQFYSELYDSYRALVDDVDVAKNWSEEFAVRRNALRTRQKPESPDPYPPLTEGVKHEVQGRIKKQTNYKSWWQWHDP